MDTEDRKEQNGGGFTDGSDIEVIQDSSDSIEVLDNYNGDNNGQRSVPAKAGDDLIVFSDEEAAKISDSVAAGQLKLRGSGKQRQLGEVDDGDKAIGTESEDASLSSKCDTISVQESTSSETPTLHSVSSGNLGDVDRVASGQSYSMYGNTRLLKDTLQREFSQSSMSPQSTPPNSRREWRQNTGNYSESPASSSYSQSPHDSPTHRPGPSVPLEPTIVDLTGDGSSRPDSLSLPRPQQYYERQRYTKKDSFSSFSSRSSSMDALLEAASSTPLSTQGTLTMDGDMMSFVAEGLETMIKMSSPMSRQGSILCCRTFLGVLLFWS